MRISRLVLAALLLSLIAVTSAAQPGRYQSLGGEFGQNLMRELKAEDQPAPSDGLENDLWGWGGSPHGKSVRYGQIVDTSKNASPPIIAAVNWMKAMGYANPIFMNSSSPYGNFSRNASFPGLSADPWIMAQQLGRPVVANDILYYPAFQSW